MATKKKVNRRNRSYRVRDDLLKEAKLKRLNVAQFLEDNLEKYLLGHAKCPTCGKSIEE